MSAPIVVADSGPLIILARCDLLPLLVSAFGGIHIPQAVVDETTGVPERPGATAIRNFIEQHAQVHANVDDAFYAAAIRHLDVGEAQALGLARRLQCGVLMDERRGRQFARQHGVPLFGVLGVLLQAKRSGHIAQIAPVMMRMSELGYRLSPALVKGVLTRAGEG